MFVERETTCPRRLRLEERDLFTPYLQPTVETQPTNSLAEVFETL